MTIVPTSAPATTFLDLVNSIVWTDLTALLVSVNPNTNKEFIPTLHVEFTEDANGVLPAIQLNCKVAAGMTAAYRTPWIVKDSIANVISVIDPVPLNVIGGQVNKSPHFGWQPPAPGIYLFQCEVRAYTPGGSSGSLVPQIGCHSALAAPARVRVLPLSSIWHDG